MGETDASAVALIEQQTLSPWSLSSLLEELKQDRGVMLVAEAETGVDSVLEIVGWCACRYIAPEAELLKIAVSRTSRRAGVAVKLLNDLILFLRQRNIEMLFLEVRSHNQSALNFYKKSGFLQVGTRPGYYSNPDDSALLFQKMLK